MKKLFIIVGFLITFTLTSLAVYANTNYLHTITLEKNNNGYNVILGSDKVAKVSKKTPSENELILELSGITSSDTVNALYKGTNEIDGLVIENTANNKLRIYITANNIKYSSIIVETQNGTSAIVGEAFPIDKAVWTLFVIAALGIMIKISKSVLEEENKIMIKKDIKTREIELYKKYRKSLEESSSIYGKKNIQMHNMLKKIDRRIDERLASSIK